MPNGKKIEAEVKPKISPVVRIIGSHPIFYSVIVVAAVGAALFFFFIVPMVRDLEPGGAASLSDAQARLDAARAELKSTSQVIERVASISAEAKEKLAAVLPAEQDMPSLIVQLASIASASNIILQGFDVTITDAKNQEGQISAVKTADIVMNASGVAYANLKAFLANIESSQRLLDFHGITVAPEGGSASVNLRTYFVPAK